jgi:hypothetical protein
MKPPDPVLECFRVVESICAFMQSIPEEPCLLPWDRRRVYIVHSIVHEIGSDLKGKPGPREA